MDLNYYLLGIMCGIVVGVLLILLLIARKTISFQFDERQKLARQKGLSVFCAFLSAGAAAVIVLDMGEALTPYLASVILETAAFLGAAIFVTITVRNDAWMSMEENPKKIIPLCFAVLLLNLAVVAMRLVREGFVLSVLLNVYCVLLMLWILLCWFIHRSKKGAADEESEA